MKKVLLAVLLTMASAASAEETSRWRLGAGYAPMVGLKTEFKGFGDVPMLPAPTGGQNYNYLNGFVRVDASGNAGGQTTFWSYDNASQEVGGDIVYQALSSGDAVSGGDISDSNLAAAAGFEIYGYYDLGQVNLPGLKERGVTWGLRTGIQYAHADLRNSSGADARMGVITDAFSLGGFAAPGAPYTGSFSGPGNLLGDTPVRSVGTSVARINGSRDLEVHMAVTSFGSYLQIPVNPKLDLMVEGGVILALANGTYEYENDITVAGSGTQRTRGRDSRNRFLPGFYTGLGLNYHLTEKVSLTAAARYQYMDGFAVTARGSTAELNFDSAFTLSLGVLYRF